MDLELIQYGAYLAVSAALTVWVGRTLSRSGSRLLMEVLADKALADSVGRLLVVGFYLLAFGGVALLINADGEVSTASDVVRTVATRVGIVLLMLGAVHIVNILILHRLRRPASSGGAGWGRPAPQDRPEPRILRG